MKKSYPRSPVFDVKEVIYVGPHLLCANMTGRGVGLCKEWRRGPDGCLAETFFAQNYNILGLIGPKTFLAKSMMLTL
jgi:hypothetical protein